MFIYSVLMFTGNLFTYIRIYNIIIIYDNINRRDRYGYFKYMKVVVNMGYKYVCSQNY